MTTRESSQNEPKYSTLLPGALSSKQRGAAATYGAASTKEPPPPAKPQHTPRLNRRAGPKRAWSMHDSSIGVGDYSEHGSSTATERTGLFQKLQDRMDAANSSRQAKHSNADALKNFVYYIVYALVNVIISVPGLIGYAAVIFSHEVFTPHMNALAKLVIFSSLIHQLSFSLFSSLPFAIGTVQDAGLIFLSSMSRAIATKILEDGGTEAEVLSTSLVLLSIGTASLGLVLIVMGHFRLADAVSYLPMPVVGGYLAFIGYFCLEAGVGLSVSQSMSTLADWAYLADPKTLLLAVPGLLAGIVLTWVSRKATNDAALPLAMVLIPGIFYLVVLITGVGLDGAREAGWVGEIAPPVPVSNLFGLVDFSLVRWNLIGQIFPTWVGMVLVVSFASCLDVAAISMDMGEALDTNKELATVGIGNLMSGLTMGYTGSYIFSQTIFTYRTGVHSRWIGVFIMLVFAYVVASPVNILQVAPLFFLGSTLIFIGYDLLYEWLFEIRDKIFLSEYMVVWATFIAIQLTNLDAGIAIGVLVAIVDHVVHSAKNTGVIRVSKRSRAVWSPDETKILQDHGYNPQTPKIVTVEVSGSVFFGSSLGLLHRILDEMGIDLQQEDEPVIAKTPVFKSPHTPRYLLLNSQGVMSAKRRETGSSLTRRSPPKYLAIDLTKLHNLDASASRGCFLQLVKICAKRGITVCACGASYRVEWMLRSHDVAYSIEDEQRIKGGYSERDQAPDSERLLLFVTIHEALAFCENALIDRMGKTNSAIRDRFSKQLSEEENSLSTVFAHVLGLPEREANILKKLDGKRYHTLRVLRAGEEVFSTNTNSDAFYVVLKGTVAVAIDSDDPRHNEKSRRNIISGAGPVRPSASFSDLLDPNIFRDDSDVSPMVITNVWPVGGVFGYVDFFLERPRHFRTVATKDKTIVAKITMPQLALMQREDPVLDGLVQRVVLQASLLDLANCTCSE